MFTKKILRKKLINEIKKYNRRGGVGDVKPVHRTA